MPCCDATAVIWLYQVLYELLVMYSKLGHADAAEDTLGTFLQTGPTFCSRPGLMC